MKKILLIIALIFCIFQMVVLATAIDMGNAAKNKNGTESTGLTFFDTINAANGTGTITTVEIYANTEMAGCEVATIYAEDATHHTTRDYETVDNGNGAGVVLAGSKQTFTVDLDVVEGDFIGIYFTAGKIEKIHTIGTNRYMSGDKIPCDNEASYANSGTLSLYGTGATEEAEEDNAIWFGFNF